MSDRLDVHDLEISSRRAGVVHFVFLILVLAVLALLVMSAGAIVIEWGN